MALRRRASALEDDELEVMELVEPLEARLGELGAQVDALDESMAAARATLAEAEVEIDAELETETAERARAAEAADSEALAAYEALRSRLGGVAIAELDHSRCGACHLTLPAVELDRIRHLDPDDAVHCEECGRLLAR